MRLMTLFILVGIHVSSFAADLEKPALILQITVDQLRGDLVSKFYEGFGEGGFRYLWESGMVYSNAHHDHANTETIVGHATLATGAYPSIHGMVGNLWFDRESGQTVYNIEDPDYRLLSSGGGVDQETEIDPTQRAARSDGRSPAAIMVSTFADELIASNNGKSKVFGVSVKDRGAVSMAGHGGKAFWFSKASGEYVTSTYYFDSYPQWVNEWNAQRKVSQFDNAHWELTHPLEYYQFGTADDAEWETDLAGFGRTFPHPYGSVDSPYFTTLLTLSPAGDDLTLDFAKALIDAESIGQDEVTDFLGISFSSTDYVGHMFGHSSLEAEANLYALDATLADLFAYLDENIGLEKVLIVLSADHGGPDSPGYLNSLNIPGGYIDPDAWDSEEPIERIKEQFGIGGVLIETYEPPYLYLSQAIINNPAIDQQRLETAIVEEIMNFPGVYQALSSRDLESNNLPDTDLFNKIKHNFYSKRSGDIYIVFEPHWFINDFDGLTVTSTHGSPWSYDTYVPMVFAGKCVEAGSSAEKVRTVDIAPTLSSISGIKPPSGSVGDVLFEADC